MPRFFQVNGGAHSLPAISRFVSEVLVQRIYQPSKVIFTSALVNISFQVDKCLNKTVQSQ